MTDVNIVAREAVDKVYRAKRFAVRAHGEQKYGDEFPYALHLQAVESVLLRFGIFDEDLRVAAWLHDVLEDTDAEYEDLITFFGREIADIVAAVTEPKGGNRKWRHAQAYPRIAQNYKAVLVKVADRIANVESGGRLVDMYRKEHDDFKLAMQSNYHKFDTDQVVVIDSLFDYLDELLIEV
jgi:(p)ppGpp synthase/HD superfamily hydrolase